MHTNKETLPNVLSPCYAVGNDVGLWKNYSLGTGMTCEVFSSGSGIGNKSKLIHTQSVQPAEKVCFIYGGGWIGSKRVFQGYLIKNGPSLLSFQYCLPGETGGGIGHPHLPGTPHHRVLLESRNVSKLLYPSSVHPRVLIERQLDRTAGFVCLFALQQ